MRHLNRKANAIVKRSLKAWREIVHPKCTIDILLARGKNQTVSIVFKSFDNYGCEITTSRVLTSQEVVQAVTDIVTPVLIEMYTGVRWTTRPLSPSYPEDVVRIYSPCYLGAIKWENVKK